MVRDKDMMGDMFGNMSFDSSDEEEAVIDAVANVEETGGLGLTPLDSGCDEVGYVPRTGPAVLVRQIRERGLSFQLWPAATGLCRYLENAFEDGKALRNARVLELGSGTGMAGIMAARFGAHVTLTDLAHVLQNLQRNVDLNLAQVEACRGSVVVQALGWGVEEDVAEFRVQPPDFILASDCVYCDTYFEPLMQTLKWLCGIGAKDRAGGVGPVVLMAHLRRWKKDGHFFRMAAKWFNVEVVYRHPLPLNARTGVLVYKFTRKLTSR